MRSPYLIRNCDVGDKLRLAHSLLGNGDPCSNHERGAGAPHSVCRRGSFSDQRIGAWS